MKKQLSFLYTLLFIFLAILGYCCFTLLTMETEPAVLEEYGTYQEIQDDVSARDKKNKVYLDYDLEELLKINPDFDTWLMIPDTVISFPVVYSNDNFHYLDYDFSGKKSIYGCLYYDVASVPGSENRVIHGHNMGNNREEMFSILVAYQDQTYAEEHKIAYLSCAPDGEADVYEVFAVVNFDLEYNYPFDYKTPSFATEEERLNFISYFQKRSIYETNFEPEGKLLILSTCNRQYGSNNRLLICLGEVVESESTTE